MSDYIDRCLDEGLLSNTWLDGACVYDIFERIQARHAASK